MRNGLFVCSQIPFFEPYFYIRVMPLLLARHPFPAATFGLWQITEAEAFFRHEMPLSESESTEVATLKGQRRLEWLAGRWLLHRLSGAAQRLPLAKDAFSKPFFPDSQHLLCSLSHSQGVVGALILDRNQMLPAQSLALSCGCDIQILVEKMARLAPKFTRPDEALQIAQFEAAALPALQHILWTAKESLYKAHGTKELDFREHLRVSALAWDGRSGTAQGHIHKNDVAQTYHLLFERLELPDETGALIWTIAVRET